MNGTLRGVGCLLDLGGLVVEVVDVISFLSTGQENAFSSKQKVFFVWSVKSDPTGQSGPGVTLYCVNWAKSPCHCSERGGRGYAFLSQD